MKMDSLSRGSGSRGRIRTPRWEKVCTEALEQNGTGPSSKSKGQVVFGELAGNRFSYLCWQHTRSQVDGYMNALSAV